MIIVGVIIFTLVEITSPININNTVQKYGIFLSIALTVLIWEGNLFLDRQFAKKFPWTSKPFLRIVLQVSSNIIYTTSLIYLGMKSYDMHFCEVASDTQKKFLGILANMRGWHGQNLSRGFQGGKTPGPYAS